MRTIPTVFTEPVLAASVPGGRFGPTVTAFVAIAAAVVGWQTFRRRDRFAARPLTVVALGAAVVVAGVVFLALADDGPGSGNGVVASSAAVTLGVVAITLGALANFRRVRA